MYFFSPPAVESPPPATPYSRCAFALRGYEAKATRVRWYFAPDTSRALPFPTIFAGSDFNQPWEADQIFYGESQNHRTRKFDDGEPPQGVTGESFCGKKSDWQIPKAWSEDLPSLPFGATGIPVCCNSVLAGSFALTGFQFPSNDIFYGQLWAQPATAAGSMVVGGTFYGVLVAPYALVAGVITVTNYFTGDLVAEDALAAGTMTVTTYFTGDLVAEDALAAGVFLVGTSFTGNLGSEDALAAGVITVTAYFTGDLVAEGALAAGTMTVVNYFTGALVADQALAAGAIVVTVDFSGSPTAPAATAAGVVTVTVDFSGSPTAPAATAAGVVTVTAGGPDLICASCPISHSLSIVAHSTGVETGSVTIPYDSKINGWDGQISNLYLTFSCSGNQLQCQTFYLGSSAFLLPTAASCSTKTATYVWSAESTTITISW